MSIVFVQGVFVSGFQPVVPYPRGEFNKKHKAGMA